MKIFCIGNSRTGTTSMHYFLKAAGFKSIHHYEWAVKQQIEMSNKNETEAILSYVANSGYEAFTDHPTRRHYKALSLAHPDAFFINTYRSTDLLRKSVSSYFGFDNSTALKWLEDHKKQEEEITCFFSENSHLSFLNIDLSSEPNAAELLRCFLCLDSSKTIILGRENQSSHKYGVSYIDSLPGVARMRIGFYSLYTPPSGSSLYETACYLEQACSPTKSMPAESSHYYLINDASYSIRQYLGLNGPNNAKLKANTIHFDELGDSCLSMNIPYGVFSIPEKYTVYPEFLPYCLSGPWISDIQQAIKDHPSMHIGSNRPYFVNTAPFLVTKKGYGDLYYHGDTHTTALGSLQLLRLMVTIMLSDLKIYLDDIPDNFSVPCLGSWLGDLAVQTQEDLRSYTRICYSHFKNLPRDQTGLQNTSYIVHFPQNLPDFVHQSDFDTTAFSFLSPTRPKLVFRNPQAPIQKRVLVFRDYTATNILPSLSLIFNEVISIWDRGFDLRSAIIRQVCPDFVIVITADRFVCNFAST
ncbi:MULTISPECIES: sulfotransferase [unclassified Cyanobium]|uniref:sulfotransferase n=1 Tax=unclassified Cyanobium TaxID=2627006 RepID=UPI0020CF98B9|nr:MULTISPECIES: sulfotransferase [unclassified Cyanobium]MCP9834910.1 hypothetical protein [Cyanobium sp. La Preciosa 7G6]MCP9937673.1 hypothetical protein [Cyanobium sp. Aljojuca 7A6]